MPGSAVGAASRRHRLLRRPGRGAREAANLQMLEALMFVALLAIPLLIVTQQPPARPPTSPREEVQEAAQDVLRHMAGAADASGRYGSSLDRLVAEALQGNASYVESRLERALPRSAEFNLFLENGRDRHRLRWDGEASGESVGAAQLWGPSWSPVLAAPQVRLLDAERSALRIEAVPIHLAKGLAGAPGVRAEVDVALPSGGGTVTLTTWAPLPNGTSSRGAATLSLLDAAGAEAFVVEPAADNATLFVGVRESQGRALPAGTVLEVRLPPGFGGVQLRSDLNPAWTSLEVDGNSTYGWTLRASLASPLTSAREQLLVNATRPAWGRFHLVEARLDAGRLGLLQGLFRDVGNATKSAALPPGRGPFLSLPGAAPWSAEAPMGLVVAYPDDASRSLTVSAVRLEATGGAALLSASGVEPASGWTFAGGELAWAGSLALASDQALAFRFQAKADAPAEEDAASVAGVRADLRNGQAVWTRWARDAGVLGFRLPPRNASAQGFVETAGAAWATLNATHRGAAMTGRADYETVATNVVKASASDLARGLDESWLVLDAAAAPLGGSLDVRWDLDRLREELVGAAADTFKCYTSAAGAWAWRADRADCLANGGLDWQLVDEAPSVSLRVHHPAPAADGAVGAEERAVTGLATEGTRALGVPTTALLGTHVVELRADFRLEGPSGGAQTQTVRLLGAFDVHRPGEAAPSRPLYDAVVQAWMPDWG